MIAFTNPHYAGFLPQFFSEEDPRSAAEQLHASYAHGGGYHPFGGFKLYDVDSEGKAYLIYPGDPPMREFSRAKLRDETLILFEYGWLAIVQKDGRFTVTRVD